MKSSRTIQRPLHCAAVLTPRSALGGGQCGTWRKRGPGRLFRSRGPWDPCQGPLEAGGPFSPPQTLISIWQCVVALCCSPASVCFTILLRRHLPKGWHVGAFSFPVWVPPP